MTETLAERQRAARAKRRVEFEAAADGMAWLHAFLPADDAALIFDRLDRVARAEREGAPSPTRAATTRSAPKRAAPTARPPIDSSTNSARPTRCAPTPRATCCSTAPSTPGRRWPTPSRGCVRRVHVTVPVLTLIGESDVSRPARRVRPDRRRHGAAARRAGTIVHPHPDPPGVGHGARRRPPRATGRRPISRGGSRCATARAGSPAATVPRDAATSTTPSTGTTAVAPPSTTSPTSARRTTTSSTRPHGQFARSVRGFARVDVAGRPQTPDAPGASDIPIDRHRSEAAIPFGRRRSSMRPTACACPRQRKPRPASVTPPTGAAPCARASCRRTARPARTAR